MARRRSRAMARRARGLAGEQRASGAPEAAQRQRAGGRPPGDRAWASRAQRALPKPPMAPAPPGEPSGRAEEPPRVVLSRPVGPGKAREEPQSLRSPGASWGVAESRARRAWSHGWSRLPALPEPLVSALLAALAWTRSGAAKSGLAQPSARAQVAVGQAPRAAAARGPVAAGRVPQAAAWRSLAWGDRELRWEPEGRETRWETGGSGAGSGAAGVSTREGATRLGCATGVDGADSGGAASLSRLGDPCAGKTSRALIPGGTLTSQAMRPSTTTWTASEPDMQMPRVTAGEPRPVSMGKGSGCPWEAGPGSVMSPLLPRVPAFAYGLLRVSESPPARLRVSPRSGEPARDGLEMGTSRSATEVGDATGSVPTAAGGVARSTPASLSEFAVGGGSERLRAPAASGKTPTAMWRSAG